MSSNPIWYIQPLSKGSNRYLFNLLDSEIQEGMPTSEGPKNLYEARSFEDIRLCISNSDLKCNYWKQEIRGGPIKPWVVPDSMKQSKRTKIR